ncbi:MAG: hypothetical protein N2Z60_09635, partial [Elusimicrobiales bacterium]|nr:hypothetical protein [Elusimicrobiales bacterium]
MILNPVDFKNYLYCPRQIYYKYVYKLEVEPTVKMIAGSDIHLIFSRIEKRRSLKKYGIENFKKEFGVKLYSKEEMLSGEVDICLPYAKLNKKAFKRQILEALAPVLGQEAEELGGGEFRICTS